MLAGRQIETTISARMASETNIQKILPIIATSLWEWPPDRGDVTAVVSRNLESTAGEVLVSRDGRNPMGVRLRSRVAGDARPAGRQGREPSGDDEPPRGGGRAGRLHGHDRGLRRLHAGRRDAPGPRGAGGSGDGAPGGAGRPALG